MVTGEAGVVYLLCAVFAAAFNVGGNAVQNKDLMPQLLPAREEHVKYVGESLYVSCRVPATSSTAGIQDQLVWLDPSSQPISARRGHVHIEQDKVDGAAVLDLLMDPISSRDRGVYICQNRINGRIYSRSFQLVVFKPIAFPPGRSIQYAPEGGDFVLRCGASGDPAPQISWRAAGRRLTFGPDEKYDLIMTNVGEANNNAGESSENTISYDGQDNIKNASDSEYNSASLNKEDNSGKMDSQLDGVIHRRVTTGNLLIRAVSREDAGIYRCRASQVTSRTSSVKNFNIELRIQYKPEWLHGVGESDEVVYAYNGSDASLISAATSSPPAQFLWYKNGLPILPDTPTHNYNSSTFNRTVYQQRDYENGTSVLTLKGISADAFGEFVCRAQNQIGLIERRIWLNQTEKPLAPSLNVTRVGSTFVQLLISVDRKLSEPRTTGVLVQYRLQNTSWSEAVSARFPIETGELITIGNLNSSTTYVIRAAVSTAAGDGTFSRDETRRTTVLTNASSGTTTVFSLMISAISAILIIL